MTKSLKDIKLPVTIIIKNTEGISNVRAITLIDERNRKVNAKEYFTPATFLSLFKQKKYNELRGISTSQLYLNKVKMDNYQEETGDNGGRLIYIQRFLGVVSSKEKAKVTLETNNTDFYYKIWFDYDKNFVFDNTSKELFASGHSTSDEIDFEITMPETDILITSRLRIAVSKTPFTGSISFNDGEVEEYFFAITPNKQQNEIVKLVSTNNIQPAAVAQAPPETDDATSSTITQNVYSEEGLTKVMAEGKTSSLLFNVCLTKDNIPILITDEDATKYALYKVSGLTYSEVQSKYTDVCMSLTAVKVLTLEKALSIVGNKALFYLTYRADNYKGCNSSAILKAIITKLISKNMLEDVIVCPININYPLFENLDIPGYSADLLGTKVKLMPIVDGLYTSTNILNYINDPTKGKIVAIGSYNNPFDSTNQLKTLYNLAKIKGIKTILLKESPVYCGMKFLNKTTYHTYTPTPATPITTTLKPFEDLFIENNVLKDFRPSTIFTENLQQLSPLLMILMYHSEL